MPIDLARARRLAKLYRTGELNMVELAQQQHMGPRTVRRHLLAAGCTIRPPGRPFGSRYAYDQAKIDDIRDRLEAGQSVGLIAEHYGTTRQAVSELAKRYGFPIRWLRRRHPVKIIA